jgi:ribosomal protein S18 acetylase RimI-like enzyme
MVLRLKNTKSILPRLYKDSISNVEEVSLIEETYIWRNVQVYVESLKMMEEFLVLHSPSSYWSGASLSAYMTAQKPSTILEFAGILRKRKYYRTHLETSTLAAQVRKYMPWLTQRYTVRYLCADSSTFKPDYKHRTRAVLLTPDNILQLDPDASPQYVERLKTAPVYGYLNKKGMLVATSGVGWLTKKSFSITYTETKPRYRRRGIAKCLTSLASEPLINEGLIGVYASDVTNKPSLGVALSLGFRPHGDLNCFYS